MDITNYIGEYFECLEPGYLINANLFKYEILVNLGENSKGYVTENKINLKSSCIANIDISGNIFICKCDKSGDRIGLTKRDFDFFYKLLNVKIKL